MRGKKWMHRLILWLLMAVMMGRPGNVLFAEELPSGLDLVVVMDNSGSMLSSDDTGIVRKAVKMLINMMPAVDSRIGLIGFNTEPTILTAASGTEGGFVSLDQYQNVETVRTIIDEMVYSGDTAIGNALISGVELIEESGRPDVKKAMILFTDGVDDLGTDLGHELKEEENNENFEQALLWAKENGCPIYSLGFNYEKKDGSMSMGEDGEGLLKLKKIEAWTGGSAECTEDIGYIEQKFTEMLADICDVRYVNIGEIPGDGGLHEKEIHISPNVMEANIRINCGTENALSSGRIALLEPDGTECVLENSDSVRYDIDATAASIKLLLPRSGTWVLQVEGIKGENIKVGLLEHNNLSLEAALEVPEGNGENTAYLNDRVKIKAELRDQDNMPVDRELYQMVTSAKAEAVPRTDPARGQTVTLAWQDQAGCLEGEFTVDTESIYDIHLSVQSERFFYETDAVLLSSNQPLQLVDKIPDQEIDVKNTLEIPNIYSCVEDLENDAITASAVSDNEEKLGARIDEASGSLVLEGKKWGSSNVTVTFTDAQNNSVSISFHVKVKDFWKVFTLRMIPVLIGLGILAVVVFLILKARVIKGFFIIQQVIIYRRDLENPLVITKEYKALVRRTAGRRKNMRGVLKAYDANAQKELPKNQYAILKAMLSAAYESAANIKIIGTLAGKKGIRLKAKSGLLVVYRNHKPGEAIKSNLKYGNVFHLEFRQDEENRIKFKIKYSKN